VATDPRVSDDHSPADRPGLRRAAAFAALALGLVGLVISGAGLVIAILPRHFTTSQQQAITAWEVNGRWRSLAAGKIFPGSVGYTLPGTVVQDYPPLVLRAVRVAIAPPTGCAAGVSDTAAAELLRREGCEVLLRATYVDQTMSFVMTVGVAVLPTSTAATAASNGLSVTQLAVAQDSGAAPAGVRIVHFGGADASMYDYSKQLSATIAAGPYLVMYAAGYADGRPRVQLAHDSYSQAEITSLAQGVATSVASTLGSAPPAPHCPGAPGC
jgi:hypothetical protein